jgi:hypothetical protein
LKESYRLSGDISKLTLLISRHLTFLVFSHLFLRALFPKIHKYCFAMGGVVEGVTPEQLGNYSNILAALYALPLNNLPFDFGVTHNLKLPLTISF